MPYSSRVLPLRCVASSRSRRRRRRHASGLITTSDGIPPYSNFITPSTRVSSSNSFRTSQNRIKTQLHTQCLQLWDALCPLQGSCALPLPARPHDLTRREILPPDITHPDSEWQHNKTSTARADRRSKTDSSHIISTGRNTGSVMQLPHSDIRSDQSSVNGWNPCCSSPICSETATAARHKPPCMHSSCGVTSANSGHCLIPRR